MEIEKNIQHKIRIVVFGILISAVIFSLEYFSLVNWARTGISYLYTQFTFSGAQTGRNLRSYFEILTDVRDFRNEHNALKIRNLELEVFENFNKILFDQNIALKRQLDLGNRKEEYILGQVIFGESSEGELNLNLGSADGISKGDVVVLGNLYIGTIVKLDLVGGTVRLPFNRSSNIEVLIVKNKNLVDVSLENISQKYISDKNVRAVAIGTGTEIRLENIDVNSAVKEGDSVVIADERIGEYLLLGRIKSVDKDLAAATLNATVEQLVEYDSLSNIFVRIER